MKRALLIAAIALWCGAVQAKDKDEVEVSSAPGATASNKDQEMVCKRVRVTGTHFKQRVCRTRGQIEAERQAAQRHIGEADRYNQGVRSANSPSG